MKKTHYISCSASVSDQNLARTIFDVDCKRCLMFRARQLRGLRWMMPANREEVDYLREALGERVAGFDAPARGGLEEYVGVLLFTSPKDQRAIREWARKWGVRPLLAGTEYDKSGESA